MLFLDCRRARRLSYIMHRAAHYPLLSVLRTWAAGDCQEHAAEHGTHEQHQHGNVVLVDTAFLVEDRPARQVERCQHERLLADVLLGAAVADTPILNGAISGSLVRIALPIRS